MGLCLPIGCTPNNGGAIVRGATKSISSMCPWRQAVVSFTITFHTNRGQLFRSHGTRRQDFESKFPKISGVTLRTPFAGGDTPSQNGLEPCARSTHKHPLCWDVGPRPSCPLRSYGAPLVPQQKQTHGSATALYCYPQATYTHSSSNSIGFDINWPHIHKVVVIVLVLISTGHIYTG